MAVSKIVGVTFKNGDGEDRQVLLKTLKPKQLLQFERDPENEYDPTAVKVLTSEGKQLGFLPKAEAKRVAEQLDRGATIYAFVAEVTGGGKYSHGCNILYDIVAAD